MKIELTVTEENIIVVALYHYAKALTRELENQEDLFEDDRTRRERITLVQRLRAKYVGFLPSDQEG